MKKIIALILCLSLTITMFSQTVFAAEAQAGDYVSGIYLTYTDEEGDEGYAEAEANFEKMFSNKSKFPEKPHYEVLEADFNEDADAWASTQKGVYIAYTTTDDPNDAIRDIAAMNMNGGYTFKDFESILQEKYDNYEELGKNQAILIQEYRKMVNAGSPLALYAKERLNRFYEDDSGKDFGDYLMECPLLYTEAEKQQRIANKEMSVDPIVKLLTQMTSAVLQNVNNLLAIAVTSFDPKDIVDSTSDDKTEQEKAQNDKIISTIFEKLGKLTETEIAAFKEDPQYYDQSVTLYSELKAMGTAIKTNYEDIEAKLEANGGELTQEQIDELDPLVYQDYLTATVMQEKYKYNGGSFYDLITKSDLSYQDLYPLLGVMSEGQRKALLFVEFELLMQCEQLSGEKKAAELLAQYTKQTEEDTSEEAKKAYEEAKVVEEILNEEDGMDESAIKFPENIDDKVSIYVGVDRSLLGKTLGVTNAALRDEQSGYSNGYDPLRSDGFGLRLGLVCAAGAATVTTVVSFAMQYVNLRVVNAGVAEAGFGAKTSLFRNMLNSFPTKISGSLSSVNSNIYKSLKTFMDMYGRRNSAPQVIKDLANRLRGGAKIESFTAAEIRTMTNYKLAYEVKHPFAVNNRVMKVGQMKGLQATKSALIWGAVGWAAVGVILVTLGALAVTETYSYYHPDKNDFAPRPIGMLDVAEDENGERKTILYSGVYDTEGEVGDINAWVSRNWVSLYYTKDPAAGEPLLADEHIGDEDDVDLTDEDINYVHKFGEIDGISFNDYAFDDDTKIYLGFTKEEDSQWYFGSMFSGTNLTVSVGILSALCGIALGVTGTVFFKKSKKRKEDPTPATA